MRETSKRRDTQEWLSGDIQLISLSREPYRPSLLLKCPKVSILLDCAVDMDALSSFLPATLCKSKQFSNLPICSFTPPKHCLKRCGEYAYVDGPFEVHPTLIHSIAMESVDVILISNWLSLVALPFYTEKTNFSGTVYATDPTLQLGRLVMEELLEFFERIDRGEQDVSWKKPEFFLSFPNAVTSDPREWTSFYSREEMDSALARVKQIAFREFTKLYGTVTLVAYSSGFSIGSCNWIVQTEHEKIAYLSATSSRNSHTMPAQWDQFRASDALILTSICRFPEHNPEASVCNVFAVIVETLKRNGSVLLPICPTGVLYDLLEVISAQLDQNDISLETPVYFISPVAKSTLAYSEIYAEWLSEKKQNLVYIPEEPFKHGPTSNTRLKIYDNIYRDFCREMRTPCVIFTGHPSLRIGDAVHFLEMWGNDPRNALIMTDPNYPLGKVYGPYEKLAIRAFFFPIETRLDFSQLNLSVLPDLKPKLLILPDQYTHPPPNLSQREDFVVMHKPRVTFRYGDVLTVPSLKKTKRIWIQSEILQDLEMGRSRTWCSQYGFSELKGILSVYDNVFEFSPELLPEKQLEWDANFGKLNLDLFAQTLTSMELSYVHEKNGGKIVFVLDALNAKVRIENDGFRTVICCPSSENRRLLLKVVAMCLEIV